MPRRLVLSLLAVGAVAVGVTRRAAAEPPCAPDARTVALLPLDADAHLALYGQPVASELAHALVAGGLDVVVVGAKMAVPGSACLIIDGTIKSGSADAVSLEIHVRERKTGRVLDKLEASAPSLTQIDRAASDLAARVLPSARTQLAALEREAQAPHGDAPRTPHPTSAVAAPVPRGLVVTVGPGSLHDALQLALAAAADRHHFAISTDPHAPAMVLEPIAYDVESHAVSLARARVHVRVMNATQTLFDRVVVTDTVVGDRGLAVDQLAARTARAVLDILEPHLRRVIEGWK